MSMEEIALLASWMPSMALQKAKGQLQLVQPAPELCAVDVHCFILHHSSTGPLSKGYPLHKVSVQSKEVFVTQQEQILV